MSRDVSADDTLPTAEAASNATAPTINESGAQRASTPGLARPLTVLDSTRYVQGDELGRGGMGRVFADDDLALGRRVAIKELAQLRLAMLLEATSQLAEAHTLYQDA